MNRHLKRITAPRSWNVTRKTTAFLIRPHPGAHAMERGMPLALLLRDYTKHAGTMAELKSILNQKTVMVDGIRRKDPKNIVGLMDVISIKEAKENLRLILNKTGQLTAVPISDKEALIKPKKIINKTKVAQGKTQINLFDGTNLILTEDKAGYKTGDTILVEHPNKIVGHLKLQKGALAYIIGGKHTGEVATVESADEKGVVVKGKAGEYRCSKKHIFVIGEKELCITIPD